MTLLLAVLPAQAGSDLSLATGSMGHDLRVELDLGSGTLHGHSVIRPGALASTTLDYFLHPRMHLHDVHLDGQPVAHRYDNGRLRLTADMGKIGRNVVISMTYSGVFHDPVPMSQFTTDNPGFGVSATITERGVFFQGQSGWFPRSADINPPIRLEVIAPPGILAVTAGKLLGHEHGPDHSISRWQVEQLGRGMPLSAGRYVQRRLDTDTVPIYTYFFPDNDHLAPIYLEASARHVATYEQLHGPYPFAHFAVVENFFPSGFGMPSYTLLGSAILRLPFIPETSLRHEVAHCWWGNGVFVDYSQGNWSEGLTTYVADYLAQEEQSPEAAREYRLRILRDYALLAAGQADFPVARFLSRSSPASQVVGYGKAMYLVHMIRQQLGEEPFWNALRAFYAQWLFQSSSWQDLLLAFEDAGWTDTAVPQESAGLRETFTRQWLLLPGAPVLHLENVQVVEQGTGWQVKALLAQTPPLFHLTVPVHLETAAGVLTRLVDLRSATVPLSIDSPDKPQRLLVDPEYHLFRLLAPEEIPPTVNSIKGASELLVVRSAELDHVPEQIIRGFLSSLNQPQAPILSELNAAAEIRRHSELLFFGLPRSPDLQSLVVLPETYAQQPEMVELLRSSLLPGDGHPVADNVESESGMDTILLVLPRPDLGQGFLALFSPDLDLDAEAVADTARRITHYGKDSYLGFFCGENRLRGSWPPLASPLIKDLRP